MLGSEGHEGEVQSVPLGQDAHGVNGTVGWEYACALLKGGRVQCWGNDTHGQVLSGGGERSMTARARRAQRSFRNSGQARR